MLNGSYEVLNLQVVYNADSSIASATSCALAAGDALGAVSNVILTANFDGEKYAQTVQDRASSRKLRGCSMFNPLILQELHHTTFAKVRRRPIFHPLTKNRVFQTTSFHRNPSYQPDLRTRSSRSQTPLRLTRQGRSKKWKC